MQIRSFTAAVLTASTLFVGAFSATGAQAALTLPSVVVPCTTVNTATSSDTLTDFNETCAGFYSGNLLNNANIGGGFTNSDMQLLALQSLGYAGDLNSVKTPIQKLENLNVNSLNFDTMLYGVTYIGIHFGAGNGPGSLLAKKKDTTGFFKFDAGTEGVDIVKLGWGSTSGAVLYSTGPKPPCIGRECGGDNDGVPEPATWAMMIMGFGGVGAVMRRRRHALTFA